MDKVRSRLRRQWGVAWIWIVNSASWWKRRQRTCSKIICKFWILLTVLVLPKRKILICHVLFCRICRTYCLSCMISTSIAFIVDAKWALFWKLNFFIQHLLYLFKLDAFSYFVQYESPEVLANECSGPDNTVSPFFQHPNFFTLLNLVITSPCLLTDCFLV